MSTYIPALLEVEIFNEEVYLVAGGGEMACNLLVYFMDMLFLIHLVLLHGCSM
jgi:hypothetical protein